MTLLFLLLESPKKIMKNNLSSLLEAQRDIFEKKTKIFFFVLFFFSRNLSCGVDAFLLLILLLLSFPNQKPFWSDFRGAEVPLTKTILFSHNLTHVPCTNPSILYYAYMESENGVKNWEEEEELNLPTESAMKIRVCPSVLILSPLFLFAHFTISVFLLFWPPNRVWTALRPLHFVQSSAPPSNVEEMHKRERWLGVTPYALSLILSFSLSLFQCPFSWEV